MSKKVAVLQSNYLPWFGYFDLINQVDHFVIYDNVQFTKNDWRNRNIIFINRKKAWLTVPVKVNNSKQNINETLISSYNWNIKHWKTIQANYAKAEYFETTKHIFENYYLSCSNTLLSKVNEDLINLICGFLKIKTKVHNVEDFAVRGDRNLRLIKICKLLNCETYVSGPSGKNYIDRNLFNENKINIQWMNYKYNYTYNQFSDNFSYNTSIIDLVSHMGNNALDLLQY